MKPKFKIGDKVRYYKGYDDGLIIGLGEYGYLVKHGHKEVWYQESFLTLLEPEEPTEEVKQAIALLQEQGYKVEKV